jgi:acetylornithine deacetylase/succinyl-diaminopimelate desuccinylase-like protein
VSAQASKLASEAQELLGELIRFNTVNPPGNERPAQECLAGILSDAGFHCELLGAEPERPNLIARLPASPPLDGHSSRAGGEGPTLGYLGHVDTVLAEPAEWRHDPWSGEVIDGFLWGRGAIDMKSQVAAEVAAGAALARSGWRPARGELLIISVVDEETGGELGAQWVTREHPEKVRCDMLLNEGGGEVFEYRGTRYYGICCAEKGVFRFAVTTDGTAAHASLPTMGDNALLKMGPLLSLFAGRQPSLSVSEECAAMLEALGEDPADAGGAVARMRASDPRLADALAPMLGITFSPTRIRASEKINVIPSSAELKVDCRVPPGLGETDVVTAIAEVLGEVEQGPEGRLRGPGGARIEFTEKMGGNRSPVHSPLVDAIAAWISREDPGAVVVPVTLAGFSDSRHFRAAFPDCLAYGFFPQSHQTFFDTAPLVHGADERIDVRDLELATRFFHDLAMSVLGGG